MSLRSYFSSAPGSGAAVELEMGVTPSDGTSETLIKTNATGEVANATGVTQASGKTLFLTSQAATDEPLTVKGAGSQSGNLAEFTSSADAVLASVSSGGNGFFGNITLRNNTGAGRNEVESVSQLLHVLTQGQTAGGFQFSSTAGDTRLLVYDVDNGTLERVTVGAPDSGGAGFKVLRIPN